MELVHTGERVAMNVDGCADTLECVVAAVEGQTASLVQTVDAQECVADRLSRGVAGFLVLDRDGQTVGLRGLAIQTPESRPLIDFVITDRAAE